MSAMNSKKAWREWFEKAEFSSQLQTENLLAGQNTRDITITGQGIYCAALKLRFTWTTTGACAYTAGGDFADYMVSNFRIKSQGKLTEQLFTSGHVMEHIHQLYLDQFITFSPNILVNPAVADTYWIEIIVPTAMTCPFNVTALANLAFATIYNTPVVFVLTGATMQINVITTDVPPPLVFAFTSQTTNLPAVGNFNVTTLTQGFLRESLSLMGYVPLVDIDTIQYVLDDGRGIIYANMEDLAAQCQYKYQSLFNAAPGATGAASTPLNGQSCIETAYLSGGAPMPWKGAGRFVVTTSSAGPVIPDIVEVLIAQPVDQQLAATSKATPTSQRPRTDLAAGGVTATGAKPKVRY